MKNKKQFRYLKDEDINHLTWDSLDEMVKQLFLWGVLQEGFDLKEGIDFELTDEVSSGYTPGNSSYFN
jgi:hypothetical protein